MADIPGIQLSSGMVQNAGNPVDLKQNLTTAQRLSLTLVQRWLGMIVYDKDLMIWKELETNPVGDVTIESDWKDHGGVSFQLVDADEDTIFSVDTVGDGSGNFAQLTLSHATGASALNIYNGIDNIVTISDLGAISILDSLTIKARTSGDTGDVLVIKNNADVPVARFRDNGTLTIESTGRLLLESGIIEDNNVSFTTDVVARNVISVPNQNNLIGSTTNARIETGYRNTILSCTRGGQTYPGSDTNGVTLNGNGNFVAVAGALEIIGDNNFIVGTTRAANIPNWTLTVDNLYSVGGIQQSTFLRYSDRWNFQFGIYTPSVPSTDFTVGNVYGNTTSISAIVTDLSADIAGVGTTFLTDFKVGEFIEINGIVVKITSITSDILMSSAYVWSYDGTFTIKTRRDYAFMVSAATDSVSGEEKALYVGKYGDTVVGKNLNITGQVYNTLPGTLLPTTANQDIDWDDGNLQVLDLGSATVNVILTFSNPKAGAMYFIKVIQGATARTLTYPAAVEWEGDTAFQPPTTEDSYGMIQMMYDGTNYSASYVAKYGA